jgi:hypothetical protein
MADLAGVIQQLRKERDQAARTVEQLNAALAALTAVSGNSTRTRSRLSAAARARIAAAQRVRWAKARGNAGMKQTISRKNNTKAAQEAIIDATAYSVLTEEVGSAPSPVSRRSKIDARRRLPKAKRARWAKARGNGGQKQNVVSMPKKKTMSAAARKKIAAAQRARLAGVKAAKK